jgi:ATP-dependent DNA ligase
VNLPFNPPLLPMLAKRVDEVPSGDGWIFEPKWDGFRTIVFRDGNEILIQSRDGKSLNRYFPEVVATLLEQLPERCVLDGEIVIAAQGRLDFDALQLRVHPAASRVKLLSEQTPASVVFFDLLCLDHEDLREQPLHVRVDRLTEVLQRIKPPIHQTPLTRDRTIAQGWFQRFEGAGLDGVMAKPVDGQYLPDKRAMLKVKHERDCDCVVAGFRWYKDAEDTAVGFLKRALIKRRPNHRPCRRRGLDRRPDQVSAVRAEASPEHSAS